MRIGFGFDVHAWGDDRPLKLCGVDIPYHKGLVGHSDADVALHAVCDALLGALAMGDIGTHFPDNDPAFLGIDSVKLATRVWKLVLGRGLHLANLDLTLVTEEPKIMPYSTLMREKLAQILETDIDHISVKATTTEGLGFTGRKEGVAAYATLLLSPLASE